MSMPGEVRPGRPTPDAAAPAAGAQRAAQTATSPLSSIAAAIAVALLAALAWSILRGILELSVGLLVVSALGGWGIAFVLRRGLPSRALALSLGVGAWIASLVLTWVVTRVTLLSDRDLVERLTQTSFLDFTAQQLGLLEVVSLVLFAGMAWLGMGRSTTPR